MDELNVIILAPKWWVYFMIWLPRTTDNSTYFDKSLEIRGIESRLYIIYSNALDPMEAHTMNPDEGCSQMTMKELSGLGP